ncbi:hypothetical protein H310_05556 [Aphanomyces invadans]|uniref:CG-1 domain-containing protein n=1 Tax=Aphanomyces invadans TaxID=157072 RepID=A0A024UA29_9STRA|nr:hypothetical protein H310_05556 [Aphanomyces invadans]ETW03134.1 hypothetical protein H310_05556 [Aphanomyces invadans]|eukprot:XP_008868518.1 hypothetical protein H310_05556 [Aphanomyces invadans]
MPPMSMAKAVQLQLAARERWLHKDEVHFLLTNYSICGLPVQVAPHCRPPSGTLFVCDSVMDFKKDGWTWQKQKGSKTKIREDRAKLVVTRDNVVLGVYVHSADNPSFHRRSYSLRDESNRMILVHYLDDDSKKQAIPRDTQSPEEPFESSIVDDALADFHPGDPNEHGDGGDDDSAFDDLLLDHDMPDMEYNNHPNQVPPPPHLISPMSIPLVEISDFSPNWDFCTGGAKILLCVATPPPYSPLFVAFGSMAVVPAESISPTVFRCCAPASSASGPVPLRIATYVGHKLIFVSTDGHFLFKPTTATSPSLADNAFAMRGSLEALEWDARTLHMPFETQSSSYKRARSENNYDGVSNMSFPSSPTNSLRGLDDLDERQYKIRVVERLHEFRKVISQPSNRILVLNEVDCATHEPSSPAAPLAAADAAPLMLDDSAIAALSDVELGALSEQLIEDVVKQLVALAGTSSELLEELNSLDDAGLSLLHYVCFYNCGQLVPLLLSHGANVNQRSGQGQTPLHLAAGCGHMEIVRLLLSEQADCAMLDLENLTPADRAEHYGHMDIARYLRSLSPPSPPRLFKSFDDMTGIGVLLDSMPGDRSSDYNRNFLLGAFSTMSLHDKCALSLGTKRRGNSIGGDPFDDYAPSDNELEVSSVMTDTDDGRLMAAMELMGPDELALLEEEARVIQNNVRAWLLRRSYRHMRDTTRKIKEATQTLAKQKMDREKAAVTVQAATRSMMVRRNFLHQRNTAIKVQAAARGIICRKKFAQMKKDALASLVIQRNATGKPPTN